MTCCQLTSNWRASYSELPPGRASYLSEDAVELGAELPLGQQHEADLTQDAREEQVRALRVEWGVKQPAPSAPFEHNSRHSAMSKDLTVSHRTAHWLISPRLAIQSYPRRTRYS